MTSRISENLEVEERGTDPLHALYGGIRHDPRNEDPAARGYRVYFNIDQGASIAEPRSRAQCENRAIH